MKRLPAHIGAVVLLILLGATIRVLRDAGIVALPPNVAPITAMAIFSGAVLPRRLAFVLPLTAMLASDLLIGFYALPVMVAVYASFAISNLIGFLVRGRRTARLLGASLLASTVFYLVTNAAVWAFESMYTHDLTGLGQAYVAGLPFFRNTLLGDLGFTATFFGLYQLGVVYWSRRQAISTSPTHG